MFTGIVREIGSVEELRRNEQGARLRVSAGLAAELAAGDSVSVSGACLTVASASDGAFEAEVMNQTLSVTTLGGLEPGGSVNLEPPLRAGDPLGGHLVQGHVDGTGEVRGVRADGFARRLRLAAPPGLRRFIVERGSVTIDGVSLTVAAPGRRRLRGLADSRDPGADHAWRAGRGRPGEPRGGRDRALRGAAHARL